MDLAKRGVLPWRAGLFAALGVEPGRVRCVRQVHSRAVVRIDGSEAPDGPFPEADGMTTDRPDLLLTVTVADCLPIFLADRRTGAFALVHSGWKGTGIVVEAVRLMEAAYGTHAADLAATIGPGIGPCCYIGPGGTVRPVPRPVRHPGRAARPRRRLPSRPAGREHGVAGARRGR